MQLIPRPPGFTGTPDELPTDDEMGPREFGLMATWGYTAERAALVVEEYRQDRDMHDGAL